MTLNNRLNQCGKLCINCIYENVFLPHKNISEKIYFQYNTHWRHKKKSIVKYMSQDILIAATLIAPVAAHCYSIKYITQNTI